MHRLNLNGMPNWYFSAGYKAVYGGKKSENQQCVATMVVARLSHPSCQACFGVVGVFGKNYSGKSSVIDSALYTIYNSISKNNRKNLNIINQNKQAGCGRVEIDIDGKAYIIERKSEKYKKIAKRPPGPHLH